MNEIDSLKKRVAELEKANRELDNVFNATGDIIFVTDKDNVITRANDACVSLLNTKLQDIVGKKCHELVHKLDEPWPGCPFEKTKEDKKTHTEEVNDTKIGPSLLVTTLPIFNEKGEMLGAVHTAKNITEYNKQKEAFSESEIKYNTIFDSVPVWIFYKDRENRFVRVNKIFSDVIQMSKEELEGKSLFDLYPREQALAYWRDDKDVIDSGNPKMNIVELMDTKRGRLWVHTDKIPYRNKKGEVIGVIGFSADITERKLAEETLVKKARDLEIFYRAAVDREMKIKELKKKVQELEAKIRG